MVLPFFTVGHSTRTIPEFVDLLHVASVELVVDVRTVPRSRKNPHYNRDALPGELEPFGIAYEHIAELGGLRPASRTVAHETNAFWENESFHNYADYALSEEFHAALQRLVKLGRNRRCAIMCAEAVWWRCHRRIVADYLINLGERVFHLMGNDRVEPATLTRAASPHGDIVLYPASGAGTG